MKERQACQKGIAVPFASALLAAAITLLIVGSSLLIAGRDTRIGAALLLVFLLPTTLIFHGSVQDPGLVRNDGCPVARDHTP